MSCAVHHCEDGTIEYTPCPSCFSGMMDSAIIWGEVKRIGFDEAMSRYGDEYECVEYVWLDEQVEKSFDECEAGGGTYKLDGMPGETYTEEDVLDMLADNGVYPYREMAETVNAAVRAALKEHPDAKLRELSVMDY